MPQQTPAQPLVGGSLCRVQGPCPQSRDLAQAGRRPEQTERRTQAGAQRAEGWLRGKAPGAVLGAPCLRRGERVLVAETHAHAQVGDGRAVCQAPSEGRRPRGRVPRFRDTAESLLLALPLSLAQLVRTQ